MSGNWQPFERSWHDTEVVNCDVCGRLIPTRAWVFDGGEGQLRACSPECEELYFSYVVPRHGETPGGRR
ncbi:MAG: hypothetical protein JSS68_10740 [Actinobacteria bacterium]|nr:hypothetical protein [Actinomycetota bacterium]MBS1884346.1 hypothetical protein [Actinomycetota bacterium]